MARMWAMTRLRAPRRSATRTARRRGCGHGCLCPGTAVLGAEQAQRLLDQLSRAIEQADTRLAELQQGMVTLANAGSQASQEAGQAFQNVGQVQQYISGKYPNTPTGLRAAPSSPQRAGHRRA